MIEYSTARRRPEPRLPTRRSALRLAGAAILSAALPGRPGAARAADEPARPDRLRYQGWAGTVLMPELAEALGYLGTLKLQWVGDTISGPQDLQATATGSTDVAGAFNGSVMKLIGAGAPVKAVIAYQGADRDTCSGLFVPEASPIRSPADLTGRIVGVNTLRAQQECFVDQLMSSRGLAAGTVRNTTLVSLSPTVAEAALRHGTIDAACLSAFFRNKAIADGGLRELANDVQLYGPANMDSLILRDSYRARFPDQTAAFVAATARAIAWLQAASRPDAVALLTDIIRRRGRGESEIPVRSWRSSSIATRGGVITPADFVQFQPWYGWRGDARTAALAPSVLFTNRFNPYAGA